MKQGESVTFNFTSTLPDFIEGTANATLSDPFKGALNSKWSVKDIFDPANDPGTKGTVDADGKISTAGGSIENKGDVFTYVYQTVPATGDWAATLDVTAAPAGDANGRVGLMVREDNDDDLAANAFAAVTSGSGVLLQGREATNLSTFPFGETAVGTNPTAGGTQPTLPTSIKLRKIGAPIAAYYSTDGGKTEHYIGSFIPEFAGDKLRIGVAVTSNVAATLDTATVQNFRFTAIASATPGVKGDINADGKVDLKDATLSLSFAVGTKTPTDPQKAAGDVNGDGKLDLKDATLILGAAVGIRTL